LTENPALRGLRRAREKRELEATEKARVEELKTKAKESGLTPQDGPQTDFWVTKADIAIYGGSAGGGKSWSLLAEGTKHRDVPGFGAVVFRRTFSQVTQQGGLWDKSEEIFPTLGGRSNQTAHKWTFGGNGEIQFAHLQYESDKHNYQGAEICLLEFDELTHFTESQFFYMLSRNRSTCGVRPYTRASCNPDADSWVARFLAWWIDQDTGFPISDRAGVLRWLIRDGDDLIWGDSEAELREKYPHLWERDPKLEAKSVTFIPACLDDNKILQEKDPGYRSNLMLLDRVERERLLGGNWKIRVAAGEFFKRRYFRIIETTPTDIIAWIRYWDRAATEAKPKKDPDWTVGVLMGVTKENHFVVAHVERFQGSPLDVETAIQRITEQDAATFGDRYTIGIEQDPGQAGKFEIASYIRLLAGYDVRAFPARQDKVTRAKPLSAQAEGGNVDLVKGPWNDAYLNELEGFPKAAHDDQVDGSSGALNALCDTKKTELPSDLSGMDFGGMTSGWSMQ